MPKRSTDFYGNTEILIGGTKNMSITNQNAKAVQLQALEMAREYIENNQEIPNEISHILFPPEKREYELTYWGK